MQTPEARLWAASLLAHLRGAGGKDQANDAERIQSRHYLRSAQAAGVAELLGIDPVAFKRQINKLADSDWDLSAIRTVQRGGKRG